MNNVSLTLRIKEKNKDNLGLVGVTASFILCALIPIRKKSDVPPGLGAWWPVPGVLLHSTVLARQGTKKAGKGAELVAS